MSHKLIFYLRGKDRSIVITDDSDNINIEDVIKDTTEFLSNEVGVYEFQTDKDIFLVKSSDVMAVNIEHDPSIIIDDISTKKKPKSKTSTKEVKIVEKKEPPKDIEISEFLTSGVPDMNLDNIPDNPEIEEYSKITPTKEIEKEEVKKEEVKNNDLDDLERELDSLKENN